MRFVGPARSYEGLDRTNVTKISSINLGNCGNNVMKMADGYWLDMQIQYLLTSYIVKNVSSAIDLST